MVEVGAGLGVRRASLIRIAKDVWDRRTDIPMQIPRKIIAFRTSCDFFFDLRRAIMFSTTIQAKKSSLDLLHQKRPARA